MFDSVTRVWNAKSKLEIKTLQKFFLEVVFLDHSKLINRLIADCEFNAESEKVRK